ncbi:MAG TPA: aminotransferase class I/II-fold pyridoxal phosphate-dependent enzyme [Vicinamibacterales bacterium]|nr:aminotransferase class I/II-fold pyridoxal phosphate-dependent enzyme [Vicinamibacterales bacterium]
MLTRRRFVHTLGLGAAACVGARGRENAIWSALETPLEAVERGVICLSSNENPLGPGPAVLDAIKAAFGPAGATPGRYSGSARDLIDALATRLAVKPENIVLGCGSTQILRSCTHLFTAKDKPLVGTIPTYEECAGYAEMMGHPVRPVALDASLEVDLGTLAAAAKGSGLVFYCNPNNPTATYVGARATREFLARVNRESPDTTVLVDEAYYDYVTDPDHATHIPIAVENPRVIVARTFSKAYGMAGLRIGYAVGHPETIKQMAEWDAGSGTSSLNVLAMRAAIAATEREESFVASERARNKDVRDFTMKWFADRGMTPTRSQANFMFVNIGRPVKEFRDACARQGVKVARDFPPFEKTHCRISFGTMDEMKKAVAVFDRILGKKAAAA